MSTAPAPYPDLATSTPEGRALLAEILPSEMKWANLQSRVLFGGRKVDELDLPRLRRVVSDARYLRREKGRRSNPAPGTCWQCGREAGGTSVECRPCHEGVTPRAYADMNRSFFHTAAEPLPSWMR